MQDGEPLLQPVMKAGRRLAPSPPLQEIRHHFTAHLAQLPNHLRRLEAGVPYEVRISQALQALAGRVDQCL